MHYTHKLLTVIGLGLSSIVSASAGQLSARLGATYVVTVDHSSDAAYNVSTEDKLIPEFDVTYTFNDNWSLELVLTIPQEHDVQLNGTGIGSFKELPPTLLAKYTFSPIGAFKPYVGAGINATLIWDAELAGGAATLDNWSFGPAVQVGADYAVSEKWSVNVDVKRAMLRSDVYLSGSKLVEARLDPWLISLGMRYQF